MCGICLVWIRKKCGICLESLSKDVEKAIHPRGPDSLHTLILSTKNGDLLASGAVLYIRGKSVCKQPLKDKDGNILLWNGEVFGEFPEVLPGESDSVAVLRALRMRKSENVMDVMSKIHGPFSFTYIEKNGDVWYGKDPLGRRSLVLAIPKTKEEVDDSPLIVSSVAFKLPESSSLEWVEVPIGGIFREKNDGKKECYTWPHIHRNSHSFRTFPWNPATPEPLLKLLTSDEKEIMEVSENIENEVPMLRLFNALENAVRVRASRTVPPLLDKSDSRIAIMFSGGLDCMVLAALVDKVLDVAECVDLINVAFTGDISNQDIIKNPKLRDIIYEKVPDRATSINALEELRRISKRHWRLIEVNITTEELQKESSSISKLLEPRKSMMDFNIASILYFASRGKGIVHNNRYKIEEKAENTIPGARYGDVERLSKILEDIGKAGKIPTLTTNNEIKRGIKRRRDKDEKIIEASENVMNVEKENVNDGVYTSKAKIYFSGLGADELFGGYGRHRKVAKISGIKALEAELRKDFARLWHRNLARDDRMISAFGREARHPYLAKMVLEVVKKLKVTDLCNLSLAPGEGDKLILRLIALHLNLRQASVLVKRAMQFGTRLANSKVPGQTDIPEDLKVRQFVNKQFLDKVSKKMRE